MELVVGTSVELATAMEVVTMDDIVMASPITELTELARFHGYKKIIATVKARLYGHFLMTTIAAVNY